MNGDAAGSDRGALVSNWSTAQIDYVADVTLCQKWDDIFGEMFSFKLAELIAPRIMGDGGNAAALMQANGTYCRV